MSERVSIERVRQIAERKNWYTDGTKPEVDELARDLLDSRARVKELEELVQIALDEQPFRTVWVVRAERALRGEKP